MSKQTARTAQGTPFAAPEPSVGMVPRAGVLHRLSYEAVPGISLAFPAWVAGSSVLILVRRRAVQNADGA